MRLRTAIPTLMGLLLVAFLTSCAFADDEAPDYRYRLTVEVDTPLGLHTGSSVIEIEQTLVRAGSSPANQAVERRVRGEAVAVDLPGGTTLFVLLRSLNEVDWAAYVFPKLAPQRKGEPFADQLDNVLEVTGVRVLPRMWPPRLYVPESPAYPLMVTFTDLADPTSVKLVNPDELAATFGKGMRLKRITVELTEDPVTVGIEERFAWWAERVAAGGGLVPMVKNADGRFEVASGYDKDLSGIGLSYFSTEAFK